LIGISLSGSSAFEEKITTPGPALTQGTKADTGKVPTELLSAEAMLQTAKVLAFGAKKYAAWNWSKGINYTRIVGAILRHTFSYMSGETNDPETGLSHMAHVMCEAMFLVHYEKYRKEFDDRPKEVYSVTTSKEIV
jgi:hypothetical protein